ncbi:PIH1 domain-containing protein 2 [Eurytemora carolleeae]|uniref:PIH1 domain-containing protein 2 n=1 Tax=Eurytemora carolleeae TaxID=1294199 RepID=UPI000C792634|nr:PIH1 domain-containing protein 2 [Eurytemora carolleeae]|eukprot:XP_023338110.1 PIH1 domain-containing protein 2-like [Eurytemora affinis]
MKTLMSAAQNIWESLDKLKSSDPQKYQEVVEESIKAGSVHQSTPQPFCCITVKTKHDVSCCINLLSWERVQKPDFSRETPSLPISGGNSIVVQGQFVYSACVNPEVLTNQTSEELENVLHLVLKFVESVNPGLELLPKFRFSLFSSFFYFFLNFSALTYKPK